MSVQVPKGYKQTEVGVIPEDWEIRRLHELIDKNRKITYGIVVPGPPDFNGVPLIRAQDYSKGWANLDELYRVSHLIDKAYKRSKVVAKDVLLTIVGSVGNVAKVPAEFNGSNITQQTARLSFSPDLANADYYINVLRSSFGIREIANYTKSGVQPSLNLSDVAKFILPAPKIKEQQAIAEALSDADALIESLEQLIAKKRQIKQGAMQELLTGQRRLPGFAGEWKVNRLGDLTQMCSGGTPSSSNPDFYNGQIPWVSISDMTSAGKYIASTEKKLTNEGFASCAAKMFPSGTVLYAMYASLGECSIANVSLCTSQAILGIQASEKLDGEYLYYYLQFIKNSVKNMGQQGTQANLNKGMVSDFLLNTPCVSEQKSIVEVLHETDKEISILESRLSKSQEIKQAMMEELLTGRIRLI